MITPSYLQYVQVDSGRVRLTQGLIGHAQGNLPLALGFFIDATHAMVLYFQLVLIIIRRMKIRRSSMNDKNDILCS